MSVRWLWRSRFGKDDCLWYFPGSTSVVVLRPEKDHWLLLYTSDLEYSEKDVVGWATNITKLILAGDLPGLLATEGLTKEIIEIH
jgi:hypothetical protein